jgi:hypothetical protein
MDVLVLKLVPYAFFLLSIDDPACTSPFVFQLFFL